MRLKENILLLRKKKELSQEKFAELLNVSRQAVQKWESGVCFPDLDNLAEMAKIFNVSFDFLFNGPNTLNTEELRTEKYMSPNYEKFPTFPLYCETLAVEFRQSMEEGKDIAHLKQLFDEVSKLPASSSKKQFADILFNMILNAKQREDYIYLEPSTLEEIFALRSENYVLPQVRISKEKLKEKIHGAWLGRTIGCLLGKPFECIHTDEMHPMLKDVNNFPLSNYLKSEHLTDEIQSRYNFKVNRDICIDRVQCMPVDDDTTYTVLYSLLIEKNGRTFTSNDVINLWIQSQPRECYYTAERVAFDNYNQGFLPPLCASYKNAFREWIGAMIRADYFGYINPANPESAAKMAYTDARISHIKNGIYGAMFVAAALSCAAAGTDVMDVILGGLSQIPKTSRFYENIMNIIDIYKKGKPIEQCLEFIHSKYDEHLNHNWCHTISNAMIVVASLLYNQNSFEGAICTAVMAGFDTDCNGATVGSIFGMINGVRAIPDKWSKPVNNKILTPICFNNSVNITDLVERTMKAIENI